MGVIKILRYHLLRVGRSTMEKHPAPLSVFYSVVIVFYDLHVICFPMYCLFELFSRIFVDGGWCASICNCIVLC